LPPGGGTTLSSSPQEKMYVALDGTLNLHVSNGENEVALGKWNSCRIAGGENRRLANRTSSPVTELLVTDERQRSL
jgi:hypothetical protein